MLILATLTVLEKYDFGEKAPLPIRAPSPQIQSTMAMAGEYLILFGGSNPNTDAPSNEIWAYNTSKILIMSKSYILVRE